MSPPPQPSIVNGVLRRKSPAQQQREEENAMDENGFNPYKAVFSTGTHARAASKKLSKKTA